MSEDTDTHMPKPDNLYVASPAAWKRRQEATVLPLPPVVHVNGGGWVYYEAKAPIFEDPRNPQSEYDATQLVIHEALRGRAVESARILPYVNQEELRGWFRRQVEMRRLTRTFVTAFPVEIQPLLPTT